MHASSIALILVGTMHAQSPDPALADLQSSRFTKRRRQSGDTEAIVGRLTGTDDRVVLCTLVRRVHAAAVLPQRRRPPDSDGVRHVVHSEPSDYDGVPLADILTAERAWVDGSSHDRSRSGEPVR